MTDFLSQAAPRKNRSDFFSDQKSAHTDRFFIGAIVCDNCWMTSNCWLTSLRFFIGLKSAHMDRYFVVSSSDKRSERFYIGAKVSDHEPIFTPIFCQREKNRSVCAVKLKRCETFLSHVPLNFGMHFSLYYENFRIRLFNMFYPNKTKYYCYLGDWKCSSILSSLRTGCNQLNSDLFQNGLA